MRFVPVTAPGRKSGVAFALPSVALAFFLAFSSFPSLSAERITIGDGPLHDVRKVPHVCWPVTTDVSLRRLSFDFKPSLLYPSLEAANWIKRAWFEHIRALAFPEVKLNGSSEVLATTIARRKHPFDAEHIRHL